MLFKSIDMDQFTDADNCGDYSIVGFVWNCVHKLYDNYGFSYPRKTPNYLKNTPK